jgi:hypothetical protein
VRRRLRQLGCILGTLLWFILLLLPCVGFYLAVRGEIVWERSRFSNDRLWLIREPGQTGIALSDTQPMGPTDANEVCTRTYVTIWLWSAGSFDRTGYCDCEKQTENGEWTTSRECKLP